MRNQINYNPYKILWFIAVFITMSLAVYAQDTSGASSFPSPQSDTSSQSDPSHQGDPSHQSDEAFNDDASQLSTDLIQQLGLTQEKADKISRVLIDYHSDIADARDKFLESQRDQGGANPDVTGGQSRADMDGILGEDVEQYYIGATPELMSDYKEADREADKAIKDVLDDQMVEDQYDQVKDQWWSDVKNRVFTSLSQNTQQPMK